MRLRLAELRLATVIVIEGDEFGTADELAAVLGPDITARMVRHWAERDGLPRHHIPGPGRGTVVYPLARAAEIELEKRTSRLGRPRAAQLTAGA